MTSYGQPGGRVPGARREKVRGYLRAANELRQTYQSQLQQRVQGYEDEQGMPGGFPDVDIVRNGDEEMLLFPSYARRHIKRHNSDAHPVSRDQPGTNEDIERPANSGNADYWRSEWERFEDANAIVDVDVRGWVYSPQRGPLSRKNRLLIAVARRLSGISAPNPSPVSSRTPSEAPLDREMLDDRPSRHEEEAAVKEADSIARRGQREANAAWRGSYSAASIRSDGTATPPISRSNSPNRLREVLAGHAGQSLTDSEIASEDEDPGQRPLVNRRSWLQATNMNNDELVAANELLLTRLQPFMTIPMANTTITIFFFNDQKSQSKLVTTNESGHFNVRAALDFVPTSVRVLASEKLSATEDVTITDAQGVSLISDVDDTIKHSAIASGAREIFKNTFIRDLGELTIKGVREWYTKLANMGVKLHYVSNSPWQLYPLLQSYFTLAGLPHGSFHLKQYSGMLQGIFEPAAERKKGSLERILHDFPHRKFVLVGDSGEADLEVYTDIVLENPGRILAVFIRDVTTPVNKRFFDQAISDTSKDSVMVPGGNLPRRPPDHRDSPASRPPLPQRPKTENISIAKAEPENLIDFSDDESPEIGQSETKHSHGEEPQHIDTSNQLKGENQAPPRPSKPSNLRSFSTQSISNPGLEKINLGHGSNRSPSNQKTPPPPPKPRNPSKSSIRTQNPSSLPSTTAGGSVLGTATQNEASNKRTTSPNQPFVSKDMDQFNDASYGSTGFTSEPEEGYVASARRQIASAYNSLPPLRSSSPSRDGNDRPGPPIPPRRGITSYPAAAARWATGATGGDPAAGGDGGAVGASYNKKEEVWRRRWARAEDIMKQKGVVLRTWRVGSDVMNECVSMVQKVLDKQEKDKSSFGSEKSQ